MTMDPSLRKRNQIQWQEPQSSLKSKKPSSNHAISLNLNWFFQLKSNRIQPGNKHNQIVIASNRTETKPRTKRGAYSRMLRVDICIVLVVKRKHCEWFDSSASVSDSSSGFLEKNDMFVTALAANEWPQRHRWDTKL